jgi:class 3 adenylate cyclase
VNLAARLVAAAEPGQILISNAVHDAVPELAAKALEPLTLKGFVEAQQAYELIHPA